MTRDDDLVGVAIKAKIAFVVRGVSEKDTYGRSRGKLIGGGGGKIWVTLTSEDAQMVIDGGVRKKVKCGVEKLSVLVGKMFSKYVAALSAAA